MITDAILALNKVAFTIGNVDIAWYGIIVTTGIVLAFLLYLFMCKRNGIDDDYSLEAFIWILVIAIVFARAFYVIPRIGDEYNTFYEMINIRGGGLTIVGGVCGGIVVILLFTLAKRKYHAAKLADSTVLPVLLGQIVGRWGNFFNQELFGLQITDKSLQFFPFAVYIENPASHYPGCQPGWYCALFFYEGLINSIGLIAGLIFYFKKKDKIKPMTMTLLYLTWYGLVRGSLEFLKIDHETIGNSNIGIIQLMCFVMAAVGIVLLILLYKGKINFETNWFQNKIEEHQKELAAALAAKNGSTIVADNNKDVTEINNDEKMIDDSKNEDNK